MSVRFGEFGFKFRHFLLRIFFPFWLNFIGGIWKKNCFVRPTDRPPFFYSLLNHLLTKKCCFYSWISSDPTFRGIMIAYTHVGYTLGMLLVSLLNTFIPWRIVGLVCTFVPIVTAITLFFVSIFHSARSLSLLWYLHSLLSLPIYPLFLCLFSPM